MVVLYNEKIVTSWILGIFDLKLFHHKIYCITHDNS